MKTGRIFDIRRFSTHDGNGLRTNIFFKGCPLRCAWCQNPEGISPGAAPVHFPNKCIGCGTCLKLAKKGGVHLEDGKIRLCRDQIESWEAIIDACPTGALAMDSREYTVGELAHEAEKDAVFYRSGGGVTISGGEPLMQGEFAAGLLEALHGKGFHTAIETSLYTSPETVLRVLPHLDQIFADLKVFDAEQHRRCTGVTNERILHNIELLLRSPSRERVTIRTPLIPGFTTGEGNLAAIAKFLSELYPEVKYELLNYNPLAEAKYHLVDREYCFTENPKLYTKAQMLAFGDIVKAHGIRNLILEI